MSGILAAMGAAGLINAEVAVVVAAIIWIWGALVAIWMLVDAFQESGMHGLLCLIVPGYFLYYAFGVSSNQPLKASVGATLLLGTAVRVTLFIYYAGLPSRIGY